MKFIIAFLFQTLFIGSAFAQIVVNVKWTEKSKLNANNVIYYNPNKKLAWVEFKAIPPPPSSVAAVTSSGFGYSADMKSTNGKGEININVYCFFNKLKSWVRVKSKNAYILEHEQHHFDATYIAALGFIQKVRAAKITTENMDAVLGALYKEAYAGMNKMQNDYDGETKNGILKDKQAEWNIFFTEKLIVISSNL